MGRLGGSSGALTPDARARLRAALGPGAQLVEGATPGDAAEAAGSGALAVDDDACALDGAALSSPAAWAAALRSGAWQRADGAFVAAWHEDGALHLARDPVGHRTAFYALHRGQLFFASTLRALLAAAPVPRRLRPRAVAAYLACGYVPSRETLLEDVFELLPGERITFRGDRLERAPYWSLPGDPAEPESEETLRLELRAALGRAVDALLPPEEAVAVTLSGGIDSSLVAALAAARRGPSVHTFSITFGAEHRDELAWSSLVAAHVGSTHHIVELPAGVILAHFDDTVAHLDKPNGDPLTVPNALLFRAVRPHARVVLNGEGGDPCFGGPKNLPMLLAELFGHGDEDTPDGAGGAEDDAPGDGSALSSAGRARTYLRAHQKCFDQLPELLSAEALSAVTPPLEDDLLPWLADERRATWLGRLMAINVVYKGAHHILPKVDALSAAFGAVGRSPLFARPVVELSTRIPPPLKLRGAEEKHLLKAAVRDLLPAAILERPKSGMLVPVEAWFQGPLAGAARERLLEGSLTRTGLVQRPALERLLRGRGGGLRPRRGVKLWLLLTLESHLRQLGLG